MAVPRFNPLPATLLLSAGFAGMGLCAAAAAPVPASPSGVPVSFNRDIRPIMSNTCFHCHGPDASHRKGGLRLDLRDEALKAGKSGELAIVPGKPEQSEIIRRIFQTDPEELMPPPEEHKALTESQKEVFRRWVAEGAVYEPHWAYTPVVRPQVPQPTSSGLRPAPIDSFIVAAQEKAGIKPSPEAPRETLLRRVTLDLTGLPPGEAELAAFLSDIAPGAWERVVDRLLASPHYGERMAVGWLDVVRFSDTVGYHGDQNQRIFPYRDYVIDAFNNNKPFDVFTREQLAGDLIPGAGPEALIATGFNRLNMVTREGGSQPAEFLAKYGADRTRTVATAWLGSTFGCAECHDHKFDPISARDFYSLQAFFADIKQWGVYSEYGYTPNPELRGYTNDSPFPPELEVDNPWLLSRDARAHADLRIFVAETAAKRAADPEAAADFANWKKGAAEFLTNHPSGWAARPGVRMATASARPARPDSGSGAAAAPVAVPVAVQTAISPQSASGSADSVAAPTGPVLEEDGTVRLEADAKPGPLNLHLQPGRGRLGSLRVELLPLPQGTFNGTVTLSAQVLRSGKVPPEPVKFAAADSSTAAEQYVNGYPMEGIGSGWKLAKVPGSSRPTGVWTLAEPVDLQDGDVVEVSFKSLPFKALRLTWSPLAPPVPVGADAWLKDLAAALQEPGPASLSRLNEAWILSSPSREKARSEYWKKAAHHRSFGGGRAMTLITKATEPLPVRILPRGNWQDQSGELTPPATPHFLPGPRPMEGQRLTRLDLAQWITSKENPLTSRTIMNRMWKQFFGNALSAVVDDLGAQGEPPSHPELLDWLAAEFQESGWNVKHMLRLIVTSATYRQHSSQRPELQVIDPNNRLLAFQNPRRLDAEFVRDNALSIAGLLDPSTGGPSVKPWQPPGYYANLQFPNREYEADRDGRQWRRGLYMHWQRTFLHPMLANFDAPMRDECAAARMVSNTPQQALTLLNDPNFSEAAQAFASRLLRRPADNDSGRIAQAWQLALARSPTSGESASLRKFLEEQRHNFSAALGDAAKIASQAAAIGLPVSVPESEFAAWTAVCRVLLNLHETITRY